MFVLPVNTQKFIKFIFPWTSWTLGKEAKGSEIGAVQRAKHLCTKKEW